MIKNLILDMDGVLSDFHYAIATLYDVPFDWKTPGQWDVATQLNLVEPWYTRCTVDFWANLPKTPFADGIIELIKNQFPIDNICVGTAFDHMKPEYAQIAADCVAGKIHWLSRYYPELLTHFQFGTSKHFMADSETILVDDSDKNIDAFMKKGGHGLLVPRIWNSLHFHSSEDVIHLYLKDVFDDLSVYRRTVQEYGSRNRRF